MKTIPRRRFTDKIRLIADEAHERGYEELCMELHELARKAEKLREDEYDRNNRHAV